MIASVSTSSKIVVEKSTVPVKTAEAIEKVLDAHALSPELAHKFGGHTGTMLHADGIDLSATSDEHQ